VGGGENVSACGWVSDEGCAGGRRLARDDKGMRKRAGGGATGEGGGGRGGGRGGGELVAGDNGTALRDLEVRVKFGGM
jgi:hypothetical protein